MNIDYLCYSSRAGNPAAKEGWPQRASVRTQPCAACCCGPATATPDLAEPSLYLLILSRPARARGSERDWRQTRAAGPNTPKALGLRPVCFKAKSH